MHTVISRFCLTKLFFALIFYSLLFPPLVSIAGEHVQTATVFGPKTFRPDTTPVLETFSVPNPSDECTLAVDNGDQLLTRLGGALVTLNGLRAIGPHNLNKEVVRIEQPIALKQNNQMGIYVQREPERFITISIICDNLGEPNGDPPQHDHHNIRQVTQWWPYLEWTLPNPDYAGNPFNLEAQAVFTHRDSGAQIRTGMFYAGDNRWRFRFTGTRLGTWTFITRSADPDLHGHRGVVNVVEQTDPTLGRGFVTNAQAPFWTWSGNGRAFVPTLVMRSIGLQPYLEDPSRIERDIKEFIEGHGFAGFHFLISYAWFDATAISHEEVDNADSPDLNPDPRAFEVMEEIIKKTYQAGGFVHLWHWGKARYDNSAQVLYGGVNGPVMQRKQRYLAARLGALPGWTLGFGFDVWEEQSGTDLERWHAFYKQHLGWDHIIGARAHHNDSPVTEIMTDQLDYIGHEDHRTIEYTDGRAYDRFVEWLETYPDKVHFSEDRFRINFWQGSRNFTPERLRRTLWHAGMAGGIAAICGQGDAEGNFGRHGESRPFENKQQLHTFATFFRSRLSMDLRRDDWLVAGGYGLVSEDGTRAIAYLEESSSLELDLSGLIQAQPAVAVDTRRPYQERELGLLTPDIHTWQAPYESDWAIAIGRFPRR